MLAGFSGEHALAFRAHRTPIARGERAVENGRHGLDRDLFCIDRRRTIDYQAESAVLDGGPEQAHLRTCRSVRPRALPAGQLELALIPTDPYRDCMGAAVVRNGQQVGGVSVLGGLGTKLIKPDGNCHAPNVGAGTPRRPRGKFTAPPFPRAGR